MLRCWRELLLLVASVAVAATTAEVLFRFYLRHQSRAQLARVQQQATITEVDSCKLGDIIRLSQEPDLFYELKPNLRGHYCGGLIRTNAIGMRAGGEPSLAKTAGSTRILVL